MERILKSWWLPPGSSFEALTGVVLPPPLHVDATLSVLNLPWPTDGEARLRTRLLAIRQGSPRQLSLAQKLTALDAFARAWLEPDHVERQAYVRCTSLLTGLSTPLVEAHLSPFLRALTLPILRPALLGLLRLPVALDGFADASGAQLRLLAQGPALLQVEGTGLPPERLLLELVRGILLGAAVLVRAEQSSALLAPMLLDGLAKADPLLVQRVALVRGLPSTMIERTEGVELELRESGGSVRPGMAPPGPLRVVGPRLGSTREARGIGPVVLVLKSALRDPKRLQSLARAIAREVALCEAEPGVSQQALFVERGGIVSIKAFAEALSAAMAEWNLVWPPRKLSTTRKAWLRSRQSAIELYHLLGGRAQVVSPASRLQGAVVIEPPSLVPLDWQERTVRVMPIGHWSELIRLLDSVTTSGRSVELRTRTGEGPVLVALAGDGFAFEQVRLALVSRGIRLLCAPGHLLQPSLLWHQLEPSDWESLVSWVVEDSTLTLEEVELHDLEDLSAEDGLIQEESALLGRPTPLRNATSEAGGAPAWPETLGDQTWVTPVIHVDVDSLGDDAPEHAGVDEPLPLPEAPPSLFELRRTDKILRPELASTSPDAFVLRIPADGPVPKGGGSGPPAGLEALPAHFRRHIPARPPPLATALLEDAEDLPEITLSDVLP